jgi:hypothetical protein
MNRCNEMRDLEVWGGGEFLYLDCMIEAHNQYIQKDQMVTLGLKIPTFLGDFSSGLKQTENSAFLEIFIFSPYLVI